MILTQAKVQRKEKTWQYVYGQVFLEVNDIGSENIV
jgi:hypothetical protein